MFASARTFARTAGTELRLASEEETKNLSLPTQLCARGVLPARGRRGLFERFYEEGATARRRDANRSQLQNLLTFCRLNKGRVHSVVVFNLTRFARGRAFALRLRARQQDRWPRS